MKSKQNVLNPKKYYFIDTSFNLLMKRRIYQILLISSTYDSFMLEEDGRIDETIFMEYVSLNLRYPPQFLKVTSEEEAFEVLEDKRVELVISMLNIEKTDTFDLAIRIKQKYPQIPIVVLTPFSREVNLKLAEKNLTAIDYVFCWLGNADILLAIIKLIEDKMNIDHDMKQGVQSILLVEDSIRFYSSYLPNIYKILLKQSKTFMAEGLNEHQKMLRMRGRTKILLATNYEEAVEMWRKYKSNLLGIITDISFKREGITDKTAGIRFVERVRAEDEYMPVLFQSTDTEYETVAEAMKVGFINKRSKTLSIELRNYINEHFFFGDFIFIDPRNGREITRAVDLKSLQDKIFEIPDDSLLYHMERNHFSKWLNARALFPIAEMFKEVSVTAFDDDMDEAKRYLFDSITAFRINKAKGVIADFDRDRYDEYLQFARIGEGSIGGKARGLAFLDSLIKRNRLTDYFADVVISIPRTVVLGTDIFDEFMEENNLYEIALSDRNDKEILTRFVKARLPFRIHEDLYRFISCINNPIAIRSSSLLEDSHYQPFAGIYSTYMIPNIKFNDRVMIDKLGEAIKSVYASAYFKDSKSYMAATLNMIDEEKMGIVLQEVTGRQYGDRFYPAISGVARSINFYPIAPERPEDGIANIAFGLGKYIVDGGVGIRFSPRYPRKILQLSTPDLALSETQKTFFALDLRPESFSPSTDDTVNLLKLRIKEAEVDSALKLVASTFDYDSHQLKEGTLYDGKRIVTFSQLLSHDTMPLAEIIRMALEIGQREMNKPVEIEFAVNLDLPKDQPKVFSLLQIRPIAGQDETIHLKQEEILREETLLISNHALGNGIIKNIQDVIYIKPETFEASRSQEMVHRLDRLNDQFTSGKKNYILIGPGRWGSSDPWLGIPVKWPQISSARLIVESGLEHYRIDPSQGTHFFQNLTSFRVGYFTVNPFINEGYYDLEFLNAHPAAFEDEYVRHVHFEKPLRVAIDGKKNFGVVFKPDAGS
ncbi:MAG TPA: PEP/pyruvate-binding domain-containing protein [Bacteroidales bacterium]|nr:PEP/pyruvate-binding domain-containing protein [Bacteroidales bacterium]HPT09115.1 PEP/pyruvate-binding domain-containing protein [Bacteroidales bacterium]